MYVLLVPLRSRMVLIVDDPEKYNGGPVGFQVVCRRFEEEKVLDLLEVIAQTIKKLE